jgi:predicted HTH transcriptional regulator
MTTIKGLEYITDIEIYNNLPLPKKISHLLKNQPKKRTRKITKYIIRINIEYLIFLSSIAV